jgi:nicotinate-nucleotide adenylyltransferase
MNEQLIGIFGGTFDPIHLGHIHLANTIWQKANLDYVKIIPCLRSPFKGAPIANPQHRVAMIKIAIAEYPQLQLDERELNNPHSPFVVRGEARSRQSRAADRIFPYVSSEASLHRSCSPKYARDSPSYTINTLKSLSSTKDNSSSLCLIIGQDAFSQFTEWYQWQEILQLANIIVATRQPAHTPTKDIPSPYSQDLNQLLTQHEITQPQQLRQHPKNSQHTAGHIWQVNINPLPISASTIRQNIAQDIDVTHYLHPDVLSYINRYGLYK